MTKPNLKPLSELVGDAKMGDVIQFYETKDKDGTELDPPRKSFVGYYQGNDIWNDRLDFSYDPKFFQAFDVRTQDGIGAYHKGDVFVREEDGITFLRNVTYYLILQRASKGGERRKIK